MSNDFTCSSDVNKVKVLCFYLLSECLNNNDECASSSHVKGAIYLCKYIVQLICSVDKFLTTFNHNEQFMLIACIFVLHFTLSFTLCFFLSFCELIFWKHFKQE